MTNEQWERYANEGMHTASQLLTEEIENEHTLEEWIKKQAEMLNLLEQRKATGYYEDKPDEAIKDWTELYIARIICYHASNSMD